MNVNCVNLACWLFLVFIINVHVFKYAISIVLESQPLASHGFSFSLSTAMKTG